MRTELVHARLASCVPRCTPTRRSGADEHLQRFAVGHGAVAVRYFLLEALARALQLDEAERAHLFDLARAANSSASTRRCPSPQRIRPGVQRILDAITGAPAWIRNGRMFFAANRIGYALYSPLIASPARPANNARPPSRRPPGPDLRGHGTPGRHRTDRPRLHRRTGLPIPGRAQAPRRPGRHTRPGSDGPHHGPSLTHRANDLDDPGWCTVVLPRNGGPRTVVEVRVEQP